MLDQIQTREDQITLIRLGWPALCPRYANLGPYSEGCAALTVVWPTGAPFSAGLNCPWYPAKNR